MLSERHGDGCDRLRTELGYGGVASPNYVRRRLQIESERDDGCRMCRDATGTYTQPSRFDASDLAGEFDDLALTFVCGDGCDRCEKTAEALFEAGFRTVRDYATARSANVFDWFEVRYVRIEPEARISVVGESGLRAVDKLLEKQRKLFESVKAVLAERFSKIG